MCVQQGVADGKTCYYLGGFILENSVQQILLDYLFIQ